ncbi:MAG: LptF/LptG family permease [Fusobacterium sp.]|uniref:LptF/LptG family permease n=1 Tax=Fusobacterium sp. TaxID=68766 RepID=UPI0026DC3B5A|nr:LptF/LptG family permease [Fusobacterium sp.]MDO4690699.1 LptF/LptG family permease [Fusobacterium sp.]
MIKKMDIYISKYFLKYFFMSSFSFLGIFLLAQMFKIIKYINEGRLVGKNIYLYILSLIPKIFIDIAPLSVLLAGLITISIMASNLEIISLKTSGIRFFRIVTAPLLLSFFISLSVFFIYNSIYTKSLSTINLLRGRETENTIVLPNEKQNAFYRNIEGNYLYFAKEINRKESRASYIEVVVYDKDISNLKEVITAKSASFDKEEKIWIFNDVNIYNAEKKEEINLKEYKNEKFIDGPDNFIRTKGIDPRMQTIKELKKSIKEQKSIGEDIKIYLVELAKRYSFPFASFIVAFIGLSVGSKYIRGGKSTINLVICIVVGYAYYIVSGAFEAMSLNGILNPFFASWIPNILYLIIGLFFMNKAEY